MWPLPEAVEASLHFVYNCLVHLQMARKLLAPLTSALLMFVSLPTPTEQLTVCVAGWFDPVGGRKLCLLGMAKGEYLPPPRLTACGFWVLDTTSSW